MRIRPTLLECIGCLIVVVTGGVFVLLFTAPWSYALALGLVDALLVILALVVFIAIIADLPDEDGRYPGS
jgi:hypothetical protein